MDNDGLTVLEAEGQRPLCRRELASELQEVLNAEATDAVCASTPVLVCIYPNRNQRFAFWDGPVEFHTSLQGCLASTH